MRRNELIQVRLHPMRRTDRLFEIIQILRSEPRSITADKIATRLEVSARTIYRDIQILQAMRTPIEGEAGVGYIMRQGYDLPALNFRADEIEAIVVGLSLISRTGDKGLQKAAQRVSRKIDKVRNKLDSLQVSNWGADAPESVDPAVLRSCIREEIKINIQYRDEKEVTTTRVILPVGIIYYIQSIVLIAWCELRDDFRHFRVDRMLNCQALSESFKGQGDHLRNDWQQHQTRTGLDQKLK